MTTKIAIANPGKYNEGELVYTWLTLPCTGEELEDALNVIGIDGHRYQEACIGDYETDIPDFEIGEDDSIEDLNALIATYEDLDEWDQKAVNAYMEGYYADLEAALEAVEEGRVTLYSDCETLEALAEQLCDEGAFGDIPDALVNHIDYDSIARDLRCEGYHETSYGVLWLE